MWSELESLKARTDALEALCKEQAVALQEMKNCKEKISRVMKIIESFESDLHSDVVVDKVIINIQERRTGAQCATDVAIFVYPDKITSQHTIYIPNHSQPEVFSETVVAQLTKPLSIRHVQHAVDMMHGIGRVVDHLSVERFIVQYLLGEPSHSNESLVKLKYDMLRALDY
jgi:hypothetical protein